MLTAYLYFIRLKVHTVFMYTDKIFVCISFHQSCSRFIAKMWWNSKFSWRDKFYKICRKNLFVTRKNCFAWLFIFSYKKIANLFIVQYIKLYSILLVGISTVIPYPPVRKNDIYVPLTCECKFHAVDFVSEVETFLLPCQESTSRRGSSIRRRRRRKCAGSTLIYTVHCPKNSLNLRIKTEPVTVEADAMVNAWFLGQIYVNNQNLRCIRSRSDRLRFYAEIQIIFGTVYRQNSR